MLKSINVYGGDDFEKVWISSDGIQCNCVIKFVDRGRWEWCHNISP
jgi:hypothetical protein